MWEREYPYAWLGILARVAPSSDELIYAYHPRGFALHSLRSPQLSRLYLQVPPGTDVADWPDEAIWAELQTRLGLPGWDLKEGPVLEKSVTPMRSYVSEPMRYGRLFLAGDAAHIVPPTGAKGLNLALADVAVLADALGALLADGDGALADAYSATCLNRVWRSTHFSWWMTSMLHADAGRRRHGGAAAAVPAALCHVLAGRGGVAGRELHRVPAAGAGLRTRRLARRARGRGRPGSCW